MSKTTDAIIDQLNEKVKEPKWFLVVASCDYDSEEFVGCYTSREDAQSKIVKSYSGGREMYTITDRDKFNSPIMCDSYKIIDLREWVFQ